MDSKQFNDWLREAAPEFADLIAKENTGRVLDKALRKVGWTDEAREAAAASREQHAAVNNVISQLNATGSHLLNETERAGVQRMLNDFVDHFGSAKGALSAADYKQLGQVVSALGRISDGAGRLDRLDAGWLKEGVRIHGLLVGKNLTVGDVHIAGAGGAGGKKKKKKPEPPVSVAYEQPEKAEKTFDYFVGLEKLKLKIDPEELKTLLAANPALKDALTALIVGGGGAAVVGKADNWEITVMRHGATHLNDNDTSVDRVRGWKDVPLSDKGKKEAQKLAEKVAKDGGLDYIASSDLKRAADTADMVAKACGLKKVDWVTEGLRPWNVGDYAGKSSKEAVPILAQYAVETPDKAVPGGESFNDFKNRFTKTLVTVRDKAGTKKAGIVTHHRGERLLKALESNDWNGAIDAKEFTKKGETTAGYEAMTIPMDKMRNIAAQEVAKWFNADLDYATLWQGPTETDKSFALNITKVDNEQQIFYGWAYVSEENGQIVVDKQDDYIVPQDLLKAAEDFTLHGGGLGDMHDARNVGRVVASFVTTKELCDAFGLRPDNNRRGWILGFKVDDADVWKKIKSGSQLELSIGGRGQRVEDEN